MDCIWEVVGGKEHGGILVREGQLLSSAKHANRLSNGARVLEKQISGDRLRYLLLSGTGPSTGWVSWKINGKALLEKREDTPPTDLAAMATRTQAIKLEILKPPPKISKTEEQKPPVKKQAPSNVPATPSSQENCPASPPPAGDVEAPVFYLADDNTDPFYKVHLDKTDGDQERMHAQFVQRVVKIKDGRQHVESLCLDTHGVVLVPHRTTLSTYDFYDNPEKVWDKYYSEIRALLMKVTGASRVIVFAHHVRNQKLSHCRRGVQGYVGYAHNDYTPESAPQRVRDMASPSGGFSRDIEQRVRDLAGPRVFEEELDHILQRSRYLILHAWHNIADVAIYADPLTVCDGRTLSDDSSDFVPFGLMYRDSVGQTFGVRHDPKHEWIYFSGMRKDEVMIFKCYDSKLDRGVRWTAHTAFADPRTPENAPHRESVEARCIVIFDEGSEERTSLPVNRFFSG